MMGGLSLWHLMLGIPDAQCDALHAECQAHITAISWPPYAVPFKFQCPAHWALNSGTKGDMNLQEHTVAVAISRNYPHIHEGNEEHHENIS
jgi:hypothetical protein